MTDRTDVLRVRIQVDDDGNARASLLGVAAGADAVKKSTDTLAPATGKVGAALGELKKGTEESTSAFMDNSRAITSFQDLLDDLASGQLGRAKRELSALANESGLLMKILSPTGLAITAVAAVLGTMVIGLVKGSEQTAVWRDAIAATGNAIGATSSQLESMTQALGAANGNYSGARAALQALAKDGKLAAVDFVNIGQAALDMSRLTGQSVGDAAKHLAELADQPAKAIEQYHLLTVAQYDQITALQKQGDTVTAEAVAERDYAQTLAQRAKEVEDSAGIITRAAHGIKAAWEGAWNAVDAIGRPWTDSEQLAALQQRLKTLQAPGSNSQGNATRAQYGASAGGNFSNQQSQQEAAATQVAITALQNKMIGEGFTRTNQQMDALATTQAVQAQEALKKFANPDQKLADDLQQAALSKVRALYGVVDPAVKASIEAEFQQEVADAHKAYTSATKTQGGGGGGPRSDPGATALGTFSGQVDALGVKATVGADTPLTHYTQSVETLLDQFDKATAKGADVTKATNLYDQGVQHLAQTLSNQTAVAQAKATGAEQAYKDALDQSVAAQKAQLDTQLASIGMGAKEYQQQVKLNQVHAEEAQGLADLAKQYHNALAQPGADIALQKQIYDTDVANLRQASAQKLKDLTDYYTKADSMQTDWVNGAVKAMSDWADQGADIAGQVGQTFTDAFGNMNDALVNFVQTGKLDFSKLVDSIIADLVRMELRVVESQILSSILSSIMSRGTIDDSLYSSGGDVAFGASAIGSAKGNAFDASGMLTAFANGGIVNSPTLFKFANGTGLMGEAGPEAIMPLSRGSDGKLGVVAQRSGGGNVTVNIENNTSEKATATQSKDGNGGDIIKVIIGQAVSQVNSNIARGGSTAQVLQQTFGLARRGVPVSN